MEVNDVDELGTPIASSPKELQQNHGLDSHQRTSKADGRGPKRCLQSLVSAAREHVLMLPGRSRTLPDVPAAPS